MNGAEDKSSSLKNDIKSEKEVLESLKCEGSAGNFVDCQPNSYELITAESGSDVFHFVDPNEVEVKPNTNEGNNSFVSDSAGNTESNDDESEIKLPPTAVALKKTIWGSQVYVVGTGHFSQQSQEDVSQVIRAVQPNYIVVELCESRAYILKLDEELLLSKAKIITFKNIKQTMEKYGVLRGTVQLLFLSVSCEIARKMGMAPGGEFRRAYKEALNIPGCTVFFGDRPLEITLFRALASLSWWQSIKMAFYICFSKTEISGEEIEKCKDVDYLEKMLEMMGGEFPGFKEVFVNERDLFLTYNLLNTSMMRWGPNGTFPVKVVGVVGMGHLAGIQRQWNSGTIHTTEIARICQIPPEKRSTKILKFTVRASIYCLGLYGLHRLACRFKLYTNSLFRVARFGCDCLLRLKNVFVSGKDEDLSLVKGNWYS